MNNSFVSRTHRVKGCVALAGAVFLVFASSVSTQAQAGAAVPVARDLQYAQGWNQGQSNPALVNFAAWTDRFIKSTGPTTVSEGVALARQHSAALAELIKNNPGKALAAAVPAAIRQQLPAEVAAELETRVSGTGDISVLIFCPNKNGDPVEAIKRTVQLNGRTYQAYVFGRRNAQASKRGIPLHGIAVGGVLALHEGVLRELEADETVPSGASVIDLPDPNNAPAVTPAVIAEMNGQFYHFTTQAHLKQVEAALEQAESGVSPYPARPAAAVLQAPAGTSSNSSNPANPTSAWTTGLKKILVIRVDFSDLTGDPTYPGGPAGTAAYMQNLIDTQVSPYYPKSSYGLTSLTNTVTTQLYRMPQTAAAYASAGDDTGLHNDAETLAAADYSLASYDRIIVVFSDLGNLSGSLINYGGLAEVSGPNVWVNGEFDFRVVSHELGHTYGLYHAGLWQVSDGNPLSTGGTTIEYGDDFDTMGANYANDQNTDFSPYFKNILGWLADSQVRTITGNGVYRINRFDSGNYAAAGSDTTLALKLVRDSEHTYWVGIRRNFTSNTYQQNGAYVIWGLNTVGGGGGGGFQSQLLDLNTPGVSPSGGVNDDYDSALQFLQVLNDPAAGLLMTPLVEGGTAPNSYVDIQIGAGGRPDLRIATNIISGGNGNGVVDPNECNSLFLVLTNLGLGGATNIQATLTTTNAHVIVTGRSSYYPDLPSGAGGSNLVAFMFSTSPGFVCGTPLNFTLSIKGNQIDQTNRFTLASGSLGIPLRYDSTGPVPIPDLSTNDSPIVVTNFTGNVLKATISLHIRHTYDADLVLQLISPDGVPTTLTDHIGGGADNFGGGCTDSLRTVLDDAAGLSIDSGFPPYIGTFRPEEAFSVYIGRSGTNVNGTWRLRVMDQVGADFGVIQCWSLFLTTPGCTDGGGECPGSDLAISGSASPEPVIIGGNLVYTISVANHGPKAAKGVTLTQLLPASVVFVSATVSQGSIASSGNSVNANIGNLPVDGVATATVTVLPTQSGILTSTASVSAVSDPDPDLSNNSLTITSHANPPSSDLGVGLAAAPNPVLVGGTLTYSISVTNNGPSAATGVVVSNTLASTVAITSATPSQGSFTIVGNTVLFNLGALNPGAVASATITVIPSAQGQVVAKSTVRANQFDPISANNTASVSTSVTPAADLAVGFQNMPASIVLGSPLTYTVTATNLGPSTDPAVFISQALPPNAQVLSSSSTAGTLSQVGNLITCDVGSLSPGGIVTMSVQVLVTNISTVTSSVNVSGALSDPDLANNSATVNTVVAPPFVHILASGARLTAESFVPANGTVDPGEAVTVELFLVNVGNVPTTNLSATLLATGGVTSPGAGSQSYSLLPSGSAVSKPFSFTASGNNGADIIATLHLGGDVSTNVSFTFQLSSVVTFANTNAIVIPDEGLASPYPSTITVSGVTGMVGKVTATLVNFNHMFPHDVNVLLVSPTGARTVLMAHTADLGSAAENLSFTFDDSAPAPLPASGSLASGSWQPSAYSPAPVFTTPAPEGPYSSLMSDFINDSPNGDWSLFVMDDRGGDEGIISNGWSLAFTTISPVNQIADLSVTGVASPSPALVGDILTYTFTVVNHGTNTANSVAFTNTLPANVTYVSAVVSQGSVNTNGGKVIANLGSLTLGASATVTVSVIPTASGLLSSTATVGAIENDLIPANNTTTVATTVNLPVADVSITKTATAGSVVVGSNLVYTITVVNNGPGNALNVVVSDSLPAGVNFVSSSPSNAASGTLTWNLGNLGAGAGETITINTRAGSAGTAVNTATVTTGSTDSNPANNTASVSTVIRAPAAMISPVGARLLAENFTPADGTVAPGEAVSISLILTNSGETDTANLVATLANTGGVTASSGSQNYGALVRNGAAVARTFNFTASSTASGSVTATLQLQDGAVNLGTATFTFALPQTNSFANTNAIIIPDHGIASPYPSAIYVQGLSGLVSKVTVTLTNVSHAFSKDVGILLVSPAGNKSVVMSGAGGSGNAITNLTLTFDDTAAVALSATNPIVSGTFKPTSYPSARTFPLPAPAGAATALFSQLNGTDPNGGWLLYVVDDASGDKGLISGGWSLTITTVNPVNPAADLSLSASASASPVYAGANVTYTLRVTNQGPSTATGVVITNILPAGAALGTVTLSQGTYTSGSGAVVCNLDSLAAGSGAVVTIGVNPSVAGIALDTATVIANEIDLDPADNAANASVTVLHVIPARLSGVILKENDQFRINLTGQPNLNYIIQATTNLSTSWRAISTNTAASDGIFQFTDTNAPRLPQRFYRAVAAP